MNNTLNKTLYFLTDDNFPVTMTPFEANIHSEEEKQRCGYFPYENFVVITRFWKDPEKWHIDQYSGECSKAEFDLWVEYWKLYWEHQALIEEEAPISEADRKQAQMDDLKSKIGEIRRKELALFEANKPTTE